jgi:predicted DNA-binding protein
MATGNQNTYNHMQRNINIRLSDELRARLEKVAKAVELTKADVMRQALENYLPILEAVQPKQGAT